MVAGAMGVVSATTALWMQGRRMLHQRIFALLVSFAITVILFSLMAWAAVAIMAIAPLPLTWILVGTLALLFALRLYRELRALPEMDPR
jgi:ABC-type bacteriocin/lantibiotic exporter with double-glycine peptidase domain